MNCRILIVDDDINFAKSVASDFMSINPSEYTSDMNLDINISNNAFYVANETINNMFPWDIIIADVFMPLPKSKNCVDVPELLPQREGTIDKIKYYQHFYDKGDQPEPNYGGFHIARSIIKYIAQGNTVPNNFQLLTISLLLQDQREKECLLNEFLPHWGKWFEYYDKPSFEEVLASTSKNILAREEQLIFRTALIQAVQIFLIRSKTGSYTLDDSNFIRTSTESQKAIVMARNIGFSPMYSNVLITGETGTGKTTIARILHNYHCLFLESIDSKFSKGEFVAISCSNLDDTIVESILFGHEKGSFTSAISTHIGVVEQATNGSLFLDEIDSLNMDMQSKLLRLLEERKFRRLGGKKELKYEGRLIICATNIEINKESLSSKIRSDLFNRINQRRIHLPSLNDRKNEITYLVKTIVYQHNKTLNANISRENIAHYSFHPDCFSLLTKCDWTNENLRGLKAVVESAIGWWKKSEPVSYDHLELILYRRGIEINKNPVNPSNIYFENVCHEGSFDFHNKCEQSVISPSRIAKGMHKWREICKIKPRSKGLAYLIAALNMYVGSKNEFAALIGTKPNNLATFLYNERQKIKAGKYGIEDIKKFSSPLFYDAIEAFLDSA